MLVRLNIKAMGKRKGTNDKYERFCSLIVEGKDAAEAYREVYPHSRNWKPESVAKRASRLLDNAHILPILARMRKEVQERADISKDDAVKGLKPMLSVDMSDFFDDNDCIKPSKEWTKEMKACVQEVIRDRDTLQIVGVKLYDRVRAIERLAKMLGWDKPTEVSVKDDYSNMTDEELDKELARLRKLNEQ